LISMTAPGNLRRLAGERGSTASLVVAAPVMLLMLMLVVHAALYLHASAVVQAAARDGARAARAESGTSDAGAARANALLDTLSEGLLSERSVDASRTATSATVGIRARVLGPVPWLAPPVSASVTSPVERVVDPAGA